MLVFTGMRQRSFAAIEPLLRIPEGLRWHAVVALSSALYLYLNLFSSPRFPFLLGGDQVYSWMGAQRLLDGQTIYRDFFQFTPPGTDLVYAGSFGLFGNAIWVTNAIALALGVLSACLCYSLSRQLMSVASALTATGLFLVLIYGKFLNPTHHWFAVFFILLAVRIGMESLTIRSNVMSGVLLAISSFFNQAHGAAALIGFVVFLLLSGIRRREARAHTARLVAALVVAFALVNLSLYVYYFRAVGLERLWFCLVESVSRYVAQSPRSLGLPGPLTLSNVPRMLPFLLVYSLVPLVYGFALWKCSRAYKDNLFPWNSITLLSLCGLSLLLEVAASINVLRLFAIAMPAVILFVWMLGELSFPERTLSVVAFGVIVALGGHQVVAKHIACSAKGQLPGGRVATTPEAFDELRVLAQQTKPGEYFLEAGWPGAYLPLELRNPLYLPTLSRWDSTRPEDIEPAIQQMEAKHVKFILWNEHLDERCSFFSCKDYLSPARNYLTRSFRSLHTFPNGDVLWQRRGN
ncbi:hypothetical protein FTW19_10675 [Terriglobus albidus]|uniref:Glycosyltransferase RgtA/B/C/D-like domain-containing protein n=1 Tax=Terriglobus albidus TaxID=1592106 RepID=A0A5B9E9T9_9BACT|nr:hypothetical protein [Terriglobus albidus]QEE28424.1 hypothetical protein FTW19_10675 [Terriglobus albidus]